MIGGVDWGSFWIGWGAGFIAVSVGDAAAYAATGSVDELATAIVFAAGGLLLILIGSGGLERSARFLVGRFPRGESAE